MIVEDALSPEFKKELKSYYNNPLRKQRFELPDLFINQRMSSNKWKSKLLNYILRFESNSWKIAQQKNPYVSRSVTPPTHTKRDLKIMAKDLFTKIKLTEQENSLMMIKEQLSSKAGCDDVDQKIDRKYFHKPFFHKQRKYKLYDPVKICETTRIRSSISDHSRTKSTDRSSNILKACEDFLCENREEKKGLTQFLSKMEDSNRNLMMKIKNYDESLYKEFVDINSEAVRKEEFEKELQRKKSFEELTKWMKGDGRMNKFLYMKYDSEVNGIKAYKRKHNLKKVAIDIRKLN